MHLELISRLPPVPATRRPLLFVHGAFADARVWDEHFLPWFARHGFAAHAVSLRGHGGSAGGERLRHWRLADYVADLHHAAERLDVPPVLVGHSLGGMVVQKYLETRDAPGAVLMASTPPQGLLAGALGMAVGDPWLFQHLNFIQVFGPGAATVEVMHRALFSEHLPQERARRYFDLMQGESQQVGLDQLGLDPLRIRADLATPVRVMGAERDAFFTPQLVHSTARTYGTEATIIPGMAHAMMLEPRWETVAGHVLDFVREVAI